VDRSLALWRAQRTWVLRLSAQEAQQLIQATEAPALATLDVLDFAVPVRGGLYHVGAGFALQPDEEGYVHDGCSHVSRTLLRFQTGGCRDRQTMLASLAHWQLFHGFLSLPTPVGARGSHLAAAVSYVRGQTLVP
jgi:hypothetical protein